MDLANLVKMNLENQGVSLLVAVTPPLAPESSKHSEQPGFRVSTSRLTASCA